MSTSTKLNNLIERLSERLELEHGGCESTTCSLAKCMSAGYAAMAIDDFIGSGAASDEFEKLYDALPKKAFKDLLNAERKAFIADPDCASVECPHCNAHVYDAVWQGKNVFCGSCAKEFPNPTE